MSGAVGLHTATIGSGPVPVVLLHGLLGQGQNLSTAARGIADLATSLLVDVPNHGRSGRTEHVDYLELADVIAGELRARGAAERPVVLVGHSMGGKIAMCLTLRHPDLVAGLVVVDVSPVEHDGAESFGRIIDAMLALDLTRLHSRAEADEALASAVPDPTVRGFVLQNLRRTDDGPGWAWLGDPRLLRAELDVVCGFPDMAGARWDGPGGPRAPGCASSRAEWPPSRSARREAAPCVSRRASGHRGPPGTRTVRRWLWRCPSARIVG